MAIRIPKYSEQGGEVSLPTRRMTPLSPREVYAAGESPIIGADSRSLSRSIRLRKNIEPIFVDDIDHLPEILADILVDGDIVVTQGAGSVGSIAHKLSKLNIAEL